MTFLQPQMLWFAGLLVPLAAVYFLKVRPIRRTTTTLFLWDEVFQEKRASALLRRLRDLLSLLLLATVLLAVVFAMARPTFVAKQDNRDLVVLIDNSASMSATEGGKSRLDLAKKTARDIFDAMSINRRAVLATVAGRLTTAVNLTTNQRTLIEGLEQIEATSEPFRQEVLGALRTSEELSDNCRVILVSDGSFEGAADLEGIELLKVGGSCQNVGIVGFDLLQSPGQTDSLELYFQLVSSFDQPKKLDVLVCREDANQVVKICPVEVQPGENPPEFFSIESGRQGKWLLVLDIDDALEADNTAYAVVPSPRPIRVTVQADREGFFFRQCVKALGQQDALMTLTDNNPELLISCGLPVDEQASKNHVIFRPTGSSPFWTSLGPPVEPSPVEVLIPDHPAVRFCDLEAIPFASSVQIVPPAGAVVIAQTIDGVPLLYKASHDGRTAYVWNMDAEESEFFLSAYFPVSMYSMARDLTGRGADHITSVLPGGSTSMPEARGQKVSLTGPDGQVTNYASDAIGPLTQPGFYQAEAGEESKNFACSLLSPAESLLDSSAATETIGPLAKGLPPSYLLVVVALGIIAAESILYHRRRVG